MNQISRPSADQASPTALGNQPSERTRRRPSETRTADIGHLAAPLAEGDPGAVPGHPHVADRPIRLVERLADRILQPDLSVDPAGDRELRAIRRPGGRLHVFQDVPRGAPFQPGPREGSRLVEESLETGVAQKRELARRRDGQEFSGRQIERSRLGRSRPRREDALRIAVPGRAVDDRLAVGGKASGPDDAAAKADLCPVRQRRLAKGAERSACPPLWPRRTRRR